MKKMLLLALALPLAVFAANNGKITHIDFAGSGFSSHPDVVQLQIEGGFSSGTCNTTFAAIRKIDTHLISAALTAFTTNTPVDVWLNESSIYFSNDNRCTIDFLRMVK